MRTIGGWMLEVLKRSRYLRKILPGWHRSEKEYLAAYERRIAEFESSAPMEYFRQLKTLESPQCMNCTNPRCLESGCPLHSDVPRWVQLAYQGRWREASQELHRANNFPEFTSQVCPAACEASCKQGLSGYPVQIKLLEGQIVQRAYAEGWIGPQIAAERSKKRVAVVGCIAARSRGEGDVAEGRRGTPTGRRSAGAAVDHLDLLSGIRRYPDQ